MITLISNFFKTKLLSAVTSVSLKDLLAPVKKLIPQASTGEAPAKKARSYPAWQDWFPFTFIYGNGKPQPIYFFVALFCFLAASMLQVKIHAASVAIKTGTYTSDMISTADLGVVLGFISSLILLYNSNKKSYIQPEKPKVEESVEKGE
jgi:hypothetical protein